MRVAFARFNVRSPVLVQASPPPSSRVCCERPEQATAKAVSTVIFLWQYPLGYPFTCRHVTALTAVAGCVRLPSPGPRAFSEEGINRNPIISLTSPRIYSYRRPTRARVQPSNVNVYNSRRAIMTYPPPPPQVCVSVILYLCRVTINRLEYHVCYQRDCIVPSI